MLKKIFKQVLIIFLLGSFSTNAETILVSRNTETNVPLGTGYNSRIEKLNGACLTSEARPTRSLPSGNLLFRLASNEKQVSDILGITFRGRYTGGLISSNDEADFFSASMSDTYSLSYNYIEDLYFQETMYPTLKNPLEIIPKFNSALNQQTNDDFFKICGDQFVNRVNYAAGLILNINISFVSKQEKEKFGSKLSINGLTSNSDFRFNKESSTFSKSNVMTVRVFQIGGSPSKIAAALCPQDKVDGKDTTCLQQTYPYAKCTFDQLERCQKLIENTLVYGHSQTANNFPSQIRDTNKYSKISVSTTDYASLGLPFKKPTDSSTLLDEKKVISEIERILKKQFDLYSFAKKLVEGQAPRLSERQTEIGRNKIEFHQQIMLLASESLEKCLNFGLKTCQAELTNLENAVGIDKNQNAMAIQWNEIEDLAKPETFLQYCDLSSDQAPDIRDTINTLDLYVRKKTKSDNSLQLSGENYCTNLKSSLEKFNELDLSILPKTLIKIGNLNPIGLLAHLKKINLSGNSISDISGLSSLVKLEEINLDNNLISNAEPLTHLENLRKISIESNLIEPDSLKGFSSLKHLNYLNLKNNRPGIACPLSDVSKCDTIDFSKSITTFVGHQECREMMIDSSMNFIDGKAIVTGGRSVDGFKEFKNEIILVNNRGCEVTQNRLKVSRATHSSHILAEKKILFIGGYSNTIEEFDLLTLNSTLYANTMSDIRSMHTSTQLSDGRIIVAGGYTDKHSYAARTTNISQSIDLIDPKRRSVNKIGKLIFPRAEHTATDLGNGKILVIGGISSNSTLNSIELIDVNSGDSELYPGELNIGRFGHNATILKNGKILISGGFQYGKTVKTETTEKCVPATSLSGNSTSSNECFAAVDDLEMIDLSTGEIQLLTTKMKNPSGYMATHEMLDGRVLLIGGQKSGEYFKGSSEIVKSSSHEIMVFNPVTNKITSAPGLKFPRTFFKSAILSDKRSILVVGGAGKEESPITIELLIYQPPK
jgi:Leucine-rich repeat (LRR) protein